MKPIVIKPKDRDEWLKAREDGIGASEVASVVGLSPWKSAFELWLVKTKQVEASSEETDAQKMGHRLEKVVADIWEEKTGWRYVRSSAKDIIYQDPEHPWRKCTPDRFAYEVDENGKRRKCLLEIKTSQIDFDPENPPVHYLCQCMYQMHITRVHVCYLCWLVRGLTYGHVRIEYDEEFANWLVENVDKFYLECVKGGKEPDLVTVSDFTIKGSDPGTSVEADAEALAQILSLRTLSLDYKAKEKEIDAYKDSIKLYMGKNESLTHEGKVLATWKTDSRSRTLRLKDKNIDELLNKVEE